MAALVNWGGKEYATTQLTDPMAMGGRYQVQLFISNGIPNLNGDSGTGWGLDGFGIGLSTHEPVQYNYAMVPPTAVTTITIDTVLFKEEWVEYSAIVLADSNYQYLTIGNFKEAENEMVQFYPESSMFNTAYYFIDDVSVIRLDTADAVFEWEDGVSAFSQDDDQVRLVLDGRVRNASVLLYDMAGREVGHTTGNGNALTLSIGLLPKGVYILRLQSNMGIASRKFVIP